MIVDLLKEMIKEKTYYYRIEDVLEIWREKDKCTGEPYFIIKLLDKVDKDNKEEVQYNTYEEQQDYLWENIDED